MKKIRVSHVGARNLPKIEIEVEEIKKIEIEKPKRTYKKREPKIIKEDADTNFFATYNNC